MRDKGTLLSDQRGAILVIAVFMAAFMCGCLWYLIGVGDAALYRQKMQDGADAAAYVSAVYHARGMNVLVVMNLVMAAILAVIIALKVAQIISGIVTIIAGAICLIPFGQWACPIASVSLNIFNTLTTKIIPKAQNVADKLLKGLSFAQKGVATVTPWVGSFQGFQHAKNYAPSVDQGIAASISMVPGKLSGDKRIGLPVQEQSFDKLCGKAGEMAANLVGFWMPGSFKAVFSGAVKNVTSTFAVFFCGGGGVPSGFGDAVDANGTCASSQQEANEQQKEFEKQKAEAEKNGTPPPPAPGKFDPQKCKDEVKKAKDKDKTSEDPNAKKTMDPKDKTAKEIYFRAQNGDDFFGVYGFVTGDITPMKRSDKGVEIPAWNKATVGGGILDQLVEVGEKVGFAKADFYYDQTSADGALDWASYKDDALWNLRWRARLRRFRLPTPDVGIGFIENGTTKIPGIPAKFKIPGMDKVGKEIKKAVGNDYIGGLIKKKIASDPNKIGNGFDSLVDQFLNGATDGFVVH
jgi:hypothetical protein